MTVLAPRTALLLVLCAATCLRFFDLGRSAVRSDEINFLNQAAQGQSLVELWLNPPWMNQIPFADSIAIVWQWLRPGAPDERSVREPFALLGSLTVIGVAAWLARRRSIAAGIVVGVWLGFLPFHVYQSREAYYYVVVMATAAGMTLYSADLLVRLSAGKSLSGKTYAAWTVWAALTCLTHMSAWVVAMACWLLLLGCGRAWLTPQDRGPHVRAMLRSAFVIGIFMIRWVWRAVSEVYKVSQASGHLGSEFAWVAPRVLPFFTAGTNAFGVVASILVLCAGAWAVAENMRRPKADRDPMYGALSLVTASGFLTVYPYVGAVGGGVGKVTYFSVLLPVFLVWATYTLDIVASRLPRKWPAVLRMAWPCMIVLVLAKPGWMITQLDGKPVPYKKLRDWLDANLDPGSIVLVDRWFEPWNEMARYAPRNAYVTFTVPDEPYETYRQLHWREVTQNAIEQGKSQAFIRLNRNHEARDGLWTWPETFFARRGTVANDAGLWLRNSGFAPVEDFYGPVSRLIPEIFYDLRADTLARKRAAGERFAVFFDPSMRLIKSGPMGLFRFRTEEFMDWRIMEQKGEFVIYNLTDESQTIYATMRGIAPRGPKQVIGPNDQRFTFEGGEPQDWLIGPLVLAPSTNSFSVADPLWTTQRDLLLIENITIDQPEDEGP